MPSRHVLAVAVVLATGVLAGCGDWDSRRATEPEGESSPDLVCGLITERLVDDLVREAAYEAEPGMISDADRKRTSNPTSCTVRLEETSRVVLEVSIGGARDPEALRQRLRDEAQERDQRLRTNTDAPCVHDYEDEAGEVGFGYGWRGCYPHDFDDPPADAGVHILRGSEMAGYQLIRVELPAWPGSSHPPKQLAQAEDIAEDVSENFITYDRQRL